MTRAAAQVDYEVWRINNPAGNKRAFGLVAELADAQG